MSSDLVGSVPEGDAPKEAAGDVAASQAQAFLEFDYAETKDLSKQFLTVVAAVLAVSVTFSEKVVVFANADFKLRMMMIGSWGLSLLAFVLGGAGVFLMFNAGQRAKWIATRHGVLPYQQLARGSFDCLMLAGGAFVLSLLLLVIVGITKLM